MHISFLENKPNVAGSRPQWLFDIDTLTESINYKTVVTGNQTNGNAGTKEVIDACQPGKTTVPSHEYILLPLWNPDLPIFSNPKNSDDEVDDDARKKSNVDPAKEGEAAEINIDSTNSVFAVSSPVNAAKTKDDNVNNDLMIPNLEDTGIFGDAYDDEDLVAGADMNNLESFIPVSSTRVHKDHPTE
ncbi:hypothetical protein Tco_0366233 [Tanacetum coccineum]